MRWLFAVSHEMLGLDHILREVLQKDTGLGLCAKTLDEAKNNGFVVFLLEAVRLHELIEVDQGHVGPLGELLGNLGLSRSFWSDHEHGLRHESLLSGSINFSDSATGVNRPDFAKLSVKVNNWD